MAYAELQSAENYSCLTIDVRRAGESFSSNQESVHSSFSPSPFNPWRFFRLEESLDQSRAFVALVESSAGASKLTPPRISGSTTTQETVSFSVASCQIAMVNYYQSQQ